MVLLVVFCRSFATAASCLVSDDCSCLRIGKMVTTGSRISQVVKFRTASSLCGPAGLKIRIETLTIMGAYTGISSLETITSLTLL